MEVKEIVIVSGKGGTGKTSLAACLANLVRNKVMTDCDVDAANLNLVLNGYVVERQEFQGGKKARIDQDRCTRCGTCRDVCRFGAISEEFQVDQTACEGCGACHFLCPAEAVEFAPRLCGHCFVTYFGPEREPFVFAELLPGEENSGKLVAMVRNEARKQAERLGKPYILIDGPPGIGCSVISSLTGTRMAVVVTEPTPSGLHDLKRVAELARHFQIPTAVVVNKGDVNPSYTETIRHLCREHEMLFLGEIPYEPLVSEALRQAKTIVEYAPQSAASQAIRAIFETLLKHVEES